MSVVDFYDGFASDYHLIYGDRWEGAIERQAAALDRLFHQVLGEGAIDVLDCSCGIGTQAIGLARLGHRVVATDVSERSIERARSEAARLGADVSFAVADFRDLDLVDGRFDVVLSFDNAIPHLVEDAEVLQALRSMRSKLRPQGLLVISIRDYDEAMIDRSPVASPTLVVGPPRRLIVRLHDWEERPSPLYTVRFLVLKEADTGWTVAHHSTRYRAMTRAVLSRLTEDAGFEQVTWHTNPEAGFHQPVLTATYFP